MSRKIEISELLTGLSEFYRSTPLTPSQLDMYSDDLLDIEPAELLKAIRIYRQDPKNKFVPLPAQLRALLRPTDDQQARDTISRIILALQKYGDPYGHSTERMKKAELFVGGLGWAIVKRLGGWVKLSQASAEELNTTAQAQWRELGITMLTNHRLGISNDEPALGIEMRKAVGHLGNFNGLTEQLKTKLEVVDDESYPEDSDL